MKRSLAPCLLVVIAAVANAADNPAMPVTWQEVEPILRASCVDCHGDSKKKGGLRLDSTSAVRAGGKHGPILIAGKPDESELLRRVAVPDGDDDLMPPKGDRLTKAQVETIRAWIAAGAAMPGEAVIAPSANAAKQEPVKADPAKPEAFKPPLAASPGKPGKTNVAPAAPAAPVVLGPSDLDHLAEGLTVPDAHAVKKLGDAGAWIRPLSANGALIEVDASHATLPAHDLISALAGISDHVSWLDLSGSAIADADLKTLAGMKHLVRLHLERTAIGDQGLGELVHLASLRWLNLHDTKVTDAGILRLASLTDLDQLNVWKTAVTPKGIEALKAKLPELEVMSGEDAAKPATPREAKKGKKKN